MSTINTAGMEFSPIRFLSAVRGFARFFFHVAAFCSFMFMIYLIAVWVEKTAVSQSKPKEDLPPLYIEEIPLTSSTSLPPQNINFPPERPLSTNNLQFPYPVDLTSREGVTIETVLLSRPSRDQITFRKKQDNRIYTIETARLHENSKILVDAFSVDTDLQMQADSAAGLLSLEGLSKRTFPVSCRIANLHGKYLPVTLLERPRPNEITFRRHFDQQVFTIPLERLSPSHSSIIRQFPLLAE
ncbi:MAG: hypothetical protein CMO55_14250 [Verrucomicrobiales bacterium]|nr:hypothetical protein [Verrucomicrobiales bacterium]